MTPVERESWTGRYGFILATVGGAVGIGNIWRFSYVAGENGGAVFLFIYLVCVVVIGIPLMIGELAVGRHARGDAVTAFESVPGSGRWRVVGWLGVAAAILLLSYYAVIAGWALKYFVGATAGGLWRAAGTDYGGYFRQFISGRAEPLAWQATMLVLSMFIVTGGIRQGIERVNRMLIPLLAVIIIVLAAFALTLPGSAAGVDFLLAPDWSALTEPGVYAAALGQTFFSLGVGMAFLVTYGSYVPRSFTLPASAAIIAVGDTLFAVIAGLAIFPAVFAMGGDPAAGPELAFITLPQIFLHMPAGRFVGAVFFFLLTAAALTSMVALLEIPLAALTDRLGWRRVTATAGLGAVIFVVGLPSALSYGLLGEMRVGSLAILDAVDHGVSNFLLPVIGIGTALFIGWRVERRFMLAEADFGDSLPGRTWLWLVRIVVPFGIFGILLHSTGSS